MTQSQIKVSRQLHSRSGRREMGLFLVEGEKNVLELLNSTIEVVQLFGTEEFAKRHQLSLIVSTPEQFSRAGTLQSNSAALAWAKLPNHRAQEIEGLVVGLDGVSDPGNLGTIWRTAHWFGCKQIWLSQSCADPFSPKVISASKGSFAKVAVVELNLIEAIEKLNVPVFCAQMSGQSVFKTVFPTHMLLVLGSESHGVGSEISELANLRLTIPRFGSAESLNVGVAFGIIAAQYQTNRI